MELRSSKKAVACGVLAWALSASMSAHADLVTNGGFETGDFTGWTQTNLDPVWDTVFDGAPHDGTFAGSFGHPEASPTGTISQSLATVAGARYDVTFWLQNEADPNGQAAPNSFAFLWGGSPIMSLTDSGEFGYTKYEFVLAATGASTDMAFSFYHGTAFWDFDSVSVEAAPPVPEPSTLALLGIGGVAIVVKRRRQAIPSSRVAG